MPKSLKPKKKAVTEEYVWGVANWIHKDLGTKIETLSKSLDQKYNTMMEHLVDIAGKFKKFGEEQETTSFRQANHSDRIEKLEKKVFGSVQI
ncbi:MAG: hypothetical protein AAB887_02120 [Patescibacteria group bacterium]